MAQNLRNSSQIRTITPAAARTVHTSGDPLWALKKIYKNLNFVPHCSGTFKLSNVQTFQAFKLWNCSNFQTFQKWSPIGREHFSNFESFKMAQNWKFEIFNILWGFKATCFKPFQALRTSLKQPVGPPPCLSCTSNRTTHALSLP